MSDYLYVIQSIKGGPVKLGKTTDLVKRLGTLQTGHPEKLEIIWSCLGDGDTAEKILHQYFADKRGVGEWFNLSPQDILNIPAIVARYSIAVTSTPKFESLRESPEELKARFEESKTRFRSEYERNVEILAEGDKNMKNEFDKFDLQLIVLRNKLMEELRELIILNNVSEDNPIAIDALQTIENNYLTSRVKMNKSFEKASIERDKFAAVLETQAEIINSWGEE